MECKETKVTEVTAKYVIKRSKAPVDKFLFFPLCFASLALLMVRFFFLCFCFVSSSTFKIITFQLFLCLSQLTRWIFTVDCVCFSCLQCSWLQRFFPLFQSQKRTTWMLTMPWFHWNSYFEHEKQLNFLKKSSFLAIEEEYKERVLYFTQIKTNRR